MKKPTFPHLFSMSVATGILAFALISCEKDTSKSLIKNNRPNYCLDENPPELKLVWEHTDSLGENLLGSDSKSQFFYNNGEIFYDMGGITMPFTTFGRDLESGKITRQTTENLPGFQYGTIIRWQDGTTYHWLNDCYNRFDINTFQEENCVYNQRRLNFKLYVESGYKWKADSVLLIQSELYKNKRAINHYSLKTGEIKKIMDWPLAQTKNHDSPYFKLEGMHRHNNVQYAFVSNAPSKYAWTIEPTLYVVNFNNKSIEDSVFLGKSLSQNAVLEGSLLYYFNESGHAIKRDLLEGANSWKQKVGNGYWSIKEEDENSLYAISNNREMVRIDKNSGAIIWRTHLALGDFMSMPNFVVLTEQYVVYTYGDNMLVLVDKERGCISLNKSAYNRSYYTPDGEFENVIWYENEGVLLTQDIHNIQAWHVGQ